MKKTTATTGAVTSADRLMERDSSLDIIRCLALFLVVSVHFLLNNGYYKWQILGIRMYVMTLMVVCFRACVPLFVMLSGYLLCHKTVNKKYYLGIIKILVTYLLASIICILYRNFYRNEGIDVLQAMIHILSFKGSEYGWYVEMYIGLFLLVPYLNLIFHSLKTKTMLFFLRKIIHKNSCLPGGIKILIRFCTILSVPFFANILFPKKPAGKFSLCCFLF